MEKYIQEGEPNQNPWKAIGKRGKEKNLREAKIRQTTTVPKKNITIIRGQSIKPNISLKSMTHIAELVGTTIAFTIDVWIYNL
jgi:hypothetical protein